MKSRLKQDNHSLALDYTHIFDAIPTPAILIDPKGVVVHINKAFIIYSEQCKSNIFPEDLIGKSLSEYIENENGKTCINNIVNRLIKEKKDASTAEKFYNDWGEKIYVDIHRKILKNNRSKMVGAIILWDDVSDKVRQKKLEKVISRVRDEIWKMKSSKDMGSVLITVRDGLRELEISFENCGVNIVESENNTFTVHIHNMTESGTRLPLDPKDPGIEIVLDIWRNQVISYRKDINIDDPYEERNRLKDLFKQSIRSILDIPFAQGTLAVNSTVANAFSEKDIEYLYELAKVLSEGFSREEDFLRLEERNIELEKEIKQRRRAERKLKERTKELERSNQELEQFAYVASHDLQEPLRMISAYTQLLARRYKGKLDSDADEFIAFAVDGATRMQRLINDLLAFSRISTRGNEFTQTDCEKVLKMVLDNLQVAIAETGAVIKHDTLPTLLADEVQLAQVFQNLISNAFKFSGDKIPHISIIVKEEDEEWIFSVKDNGIGIESDYFDRIFIVFQRLHSKEEYPGTGIGLASCKKIIERHKGRIWVESKLGEGSEFFFTFQKE